MKNRYRWLAGPALVFVVALVLFAGVFTAFPVLYDTDSYYHLAIARTYAADGVVDDLPWARRSILHPGFGDKELLFHLLLAPLAGESTIGGRWALALLNALVAAVVAGFGVRALGRWGLLLPVLVYAGSEEFLGRAIRLRPELLSLLLLLAAVACAGRRRYRLLGLVAACYALSYTAFHAFLGLSAMWFLHQGWWRRRWHWPLALYPLLGVGLGLLVHPHFPHNLVVWKLQNVDFFLLKGALDVGPEIAAQSADQLLVLNLPWGLALAALWYAARPPAGDDDRNSDPATADLLWLTAAVFGILYLLMLRFSIYFIPFTTLALVYQLRRRGRDAGRSAVVSVVVLGVALILGLWRSSTLVHGLATARGPMAREDDWAAFGRAVPPGARIAAEWGSTHVYMFWAPQGRYLNVLDPVFMAVPYPRVYEVQRAVFTGREPDVPLALAAELDSDLIALSRFHRPPALLDRLAADPRLRPRYQGYTLLYETVPGANADCVLSWRLIPRGTRLPVSPATEITSWPSYPRAETPTGRALEGYVDANRSADGGTCQGLVHAEERTQSAVVTWELAPYGPTTLWLDDELLVATAATDGAVLGRGLTVAARVGPGRHHLTVLTCRGEGGYRGFYLHRRSERPEPP